MTGDPSFMSNQTAKNRRTALILLSIALVFFVGILMRRWLLGG
jgi:hypothetical protein